MTGSERRIATRHPQRVEVDLHTRAARRRVHALDVSRHGLFISCAQPPPVHHAVLLTVHLPAGPFETMATVARRNEFDTHGTVGAGVKLYCLGADAKQRWDRFVATLEGVELKLPTRPSHHAACFLVQLDTPAALFDFFMSSVVGQKTLWVSPAVHREGAEVLFVLVHPYSHDELEVTARVVDYNPDHPLRMGVKFEGVDRATRQSFKAFLGPMPGIPNTSIPEGPPILATERRSWTDYAFFSPRLRESLDDPTEANAVRGRMMPSAEEVMLLDVEADGPLDTLTTEHLDTIEGQLLELPELDLVDKKELFDFDWVNENTDPAKDKI